MSPLPAPDPAEGEAAEKAAAAARATASANLTAGTLDLAGLFAAVDQEKTAGKYVLGHMHAKHALVALPKIGDVKADEILDGLGIKHEEHLDVLGAEQRRALEQAVIDAS